MKIKINKAKSAPLEIGDLLVLKSDNSELAILTEPSAMLSEKLGEDTLLVTRITNINMDEGVVCFYNKDEWEKFEGSIEIENA